MAIFRWLFRCPILVYPLVILFAACNFFGFAQEKESYQKPPHVPENVWNEAKPYFLPEDHPIKKRLDLLFGHARLLNSLDTMRQAGFRIIEAESELDVAFHPDLPNYVIKFYLDDHDNQPRFAKLKLSDPYISEVRLWLLRIEGAKRIQKILDAHHYNAIMKVPKEWIYPLPLKPEATGPFPKYFILVEEDMHIVDNQENIRKYREDMTPALLKAFYTVLKEGHLYDSVYIDNNPFSYDGRIAFVDTEEYDRKPVPFEKILPYLSPDMQNYWRTLMREDQLQSLSN
ncbi:hypothetical protein [Candidatus Protochlamydia phocaeensis]|uniref:hypothetical protein n=1 Tax=Candidatus Protochlamydia phocaeensis TaxID=1414722 RepID=UPI0012AC0361|nr:hypothetical protein [Candidatus Protochlamydia phocaeensis]